MPESNFIDYVKILCRSGKGGAGSRHYHRAKYVPKGDPTEATEAAEDTYSSEATHTCGHSSPYATADTYSPETDNQDQKDEAPAKTEKTSPSTYPAEQSYSTPKPDNTSAKSHTTNR